MTKTASIHFNNIIGTGTYASVFTGHWNSKLVAYKRLRTPNTEHSLKQLTKGIETHRSSIEHENIVKLYDCFKEDLRTYLVLELAACSLEKKYLYRSLTLGQRCYIGLGILAGLNHLFDQGILHRDLKSENILLTADLQPKITDFDFATTVDEAQGNSLLGTVPYIAKELTQVCAQSPDNGVYQYTKLSELYAAGVILLELALQDLIYPGAWIEDLEMYFNAAERLVLNHKKRLQPNSLSKELMKIMFFCLLVSPNERSKALFLIKQLVNPEENAASVDLAWQTQAETQTSTNSLKRYSGKACFWQQSPRSNTAGYPENPRKRSKTADCIEQPSQTQASLRG